MIALIGTLLVALAAYVHFYYFKGEWAFRNVMVMLAAFWCFVAIWVFVPKAEYGFVIAILWILIGVLPNRHD